MSRDFCSSPWLSETPAAVGQHPLPCEREGCEKERDRRGGPRTCNRLKTCSKLSPFCAAGARGALCARPMLAPCCSPAAERYQLLISRDDATASSALRTRCTLAATLWCTMVFVSSVRMSMPNSCVRGRRRGAEGASDGGVSRARRGKTREGTTKATHDNVVGVELKDVALGRLGREALAVDEGAVGRLDVLDEDLRWQRPPRASAP